MTQQPDPGMTGQAGTSVAGVPVSRHQLALALALGCERIACLAPHVGPEVLRMQHLAEAQGARFHVLTGPGNLAGLVAADDEVVVLERGMLISTRAAELALSAGPCVSVLPVETGLAAGFERIDLEHSGAGLALLPGRLFALTADLPDDFDAASALRRIALQNGVPRRPVSGSARESGEWTLVRDYQTAQMAETGWFAALDAHDGIATPGYSLARAIVRTWGGTWLATGHGAAPIGWAGLGLALAALIAGYAGFAALGLAALALGWLLGAVANVTDSMERALGDGRPRGVINASAPAWMIDAGLVILPVLHAQPQGLDDGFAAFFAPAMLLALLRILPRVLQHWALRLAEDRLVLPLMLACAALAGWLAVAIQLLALAAAIAAMLAVSGQKRLT